MHERIDPYGCASFIMMVRVESWNESGIEGSSKYTNSLFETVSVAHHTSVILSEVSCSKNRFKSLVTSLSLFI